MFKPYLITVILIFFATASAFAQQQFIIDTTGKDWTGILDYYNSAIVWNRMPTFSTCSHDFDLQVFLTGNYDRRWTVQSSNPSVVTVNGDILHVVGAGQCTIILEALIGYSGNSVGIHAERPITVTAINPPYVVIDTNYTTSCDGKTLTFKTETNYPYTAQYLWQVNGVGNDSTATFSSSVLKTNDILTCSISVPANCHVPDNDTVTIHLRPPSVTINKQDTTVVCTGTQASILATPVNIDPTMTAYQWQVNGNNVPGANSAVFTSIFNNNDVIDCLLTYRNAPSCTQTQSVTSPALTINVKSAPSPTIYIVPSDNPVCPSTLVTFTASGTNNTNSPVYQWLVNGKNAGVNSDIFTSTFKDNDIVICTVSTSDCIVPTISKPVIMKLYDVPTIILNKSMSVILGKGAQLKPVISGNIASYYWSPALGLSSSKIPDPIVMPVNNTTYTLSVVSIDGCTTQASVNVNLIVPIIVPNTFTPNGDGVNDTWDIPSLAYYPHCTLRVYNRYGALVLQSAGYTSAWDGTFKGKPLPTGTYYYIINSDQDKGTTISGPVSIIK